MVSIARFYLDHSDVPPTTRRRPHLNVVVTLDELERRTGGRTLDGHAVSRSMVAALSCDGAIHRVVTDGASATLGVGRATRTIHAALFTALAMRDQGCRFPGCDRLVSWCEAHHVRAWQDGGGTDQDNLVLLCWRHHHDIAHGAGWHVKVLPDETVEITTPDGRVLVGRPPPVVGALPIGIARPAA